MSARSNPGPLRHRAAPRVQWHADGVLVRFRMPGLPIVVRSELWLLYGLLASAIALLGAPAVAGLLVPPGFLAWWAGRRRPAEIGVSHQRVEVRAPLGRRIRVDLRTVREVDVFDGELELLLWGGRRIRLPAPEPGPELSLVVEQIRLLRDETQRFALEMAESNDDSAEVKQLLASRSRRA